uniref:AI-2E family transporter n=1 Tax=Gemmiger formicilis TaxID=745368 RepID=UPI004028D0C7
DAFVTLAVSIYLLSGKAELLQAARCCLRAALPPGAAAGVFSVCRLANRIFSGYLGGQLVDALLVGGETFALMSIFGLEYAPLLAVLVGMTNIVPVLGPFLGAVPGIVILLLEAPWKAAEFAIIIFVVQQVDGNFIAPRILGGATGLPGLGVLLAIVVGGAWFGIPGMVLGVPTLAVLAALARQAVGAGLTARGLTADGAPARKDPPPQ